MNRHLTDEQLYKIIEVNGESEPTFATGRLKECAECRQRLAVMKRLIREVQDWEEKPIAPDVLRRFQSGLERKLEKKSLRKRTFIFRPLPGVAVAGLFMLGLIAAIFRFSFTTEPAYDNNAVLPPNLDVQKVIALSDSIENFIDETEYEITLEEAEIPEDLVEFFETAASSINDPSYELFDDMSALSDGEIKELHSMLENSYMPPGST